MKTLAIFPATHEIRIIERAEPNITQPQQVKLRILEVGVCGTDKEICTFAFGTPPQGEEYLVLGHESFGEVVEVGSAVKQVRVGDLAVVTVRRPCQDASCLPCRAGRQDYCETGTYTERGIQEAHGFMTEYVVEEERYINVVPHELRSVGVLVEPLTIAEKALTRVRNMQANFPWLAEQNAQETFGRGQRAVILGAGPIGLLGAMLFIASGFETYVYSRAKRPTLKADIVEELGATYISSEEQSSEQLQKRVGRIDVVYEAVGAARVAFDVMRVLGPHGIFVFTGVPGKEAASEVGLDDLMRDFVLWNQAVFGTVNADAEAFRAAIQHLGVFQKRWPEPLQKMITGRYPLDQYEQVIHGKVGGIKNVLVI